MEAIISGINWLDDFIWGMPMIVLLLGTHLFMTVRTGFIQRKTFTGILLSVRKDPDAPGDVSQFQALTTALASTIGTGNIIGVGTAIFLGGPGAVFWCWLAGVFGIATKYAESLIAVKYRVRTPDGRMQGGAMYALERGLNLKWLGVLFAALAALASFGIGCGTQINAIAEVIENNIPVGIPPIAIGVVGGLLTGVVIIGGIQSIASVCEKLVPFMAAFYVLGCIIILAINWDFLAPAVSTILRLAFTPGAAAGGLVGQGLMAAMRFGVARGLFSNESGMGSAPLVASAAQTRNPVRQALVSATGTFWDTGGVPYDRSGAGHYHHEEPRHRHGTDIRRRPTHYPGLCTDPRTRACNPGSGHHHFRLVHHPGLVLLRRAVRPVPMGQEGPAAL